jgi:anti-anti-sigma regulatory factor
VITTAIEQDRTVLSLHGRFENLAAVDLDAAFDAVIESRPGTVVLDLAELDFMGAAGLVAVANAEERFADIGITMTVRSPSALVRGLAGTVELAEVTSLERAPVTAIPTDPDVVDGALELVVELARTAVAGADGVSISLLRHGVLSTVAATDETIMEMDTDQYATGEGPCVDASRFGHSFHAGSMDDETRWPSFTPRARALGIKAILSSPLTALQEPVGALNIYSLTESSFDGRDGETAAVCARKASVILSRAGAGVTDADLARRFQIALRSRDVIALSKGIIMERDRVVEREAFVILLHLSLDQGESLLASAEGLLQSAPRTRAGNGT